MQSRVKIGFGIEEAKKNIQQLKKVKKLWKVGGKAVRKAERRGGEWSRRGYR